MTILMSIDYPHVYLYMFLAHLYENTGRAIAVTTASASALVKFLVKVFKRLYIPNLWMKVVGCSYLP